MILEAVKKRFKTAFDADKNGGIEALNGVKIESPSPELFNLTTQIVIGSLLLGRAHAQEGIELSDVEIEFTIDEKTMPFEEAVEYLRTLISIPKKEWEKLERCVQFRAFTVAALAEADGIEKVRASLTKAVEEGSPIWESWPEIEALTERLGNRFAPGYWETVYRTNAQTAYNAGRLMQYKDNWPPAWELLFIQDKRQSDTCKDLAHLVGEKAIPSDHHFWKTYGFPPYHFNCRTTFRAVYDYELKGGEITVVRPSKATLEENFHIQDGFGGNPLEKESWWKITQSMVKRAEKYGILDDIVAKAREFDMQSYFPELLQGFKTIQTYKSGGYIKAALNSTHEEKELRAARRLGNRGHKIYLLPKTNKTSSPDMIIDNEIGEMKEITTIEQKYIRRHIKKSGEKQRGRIVYIKVTQPKQYTRVLKIIKEELATLPLKTLILDYNGKLEYLDRSYFEK